MQKVLFLCTGNYYRSRYAEILFNHLAKQKNLRFHAFSRGLKVIDGKNPGAISVHATERLKTMGIISVNINNFPKQVSISDLEEADFIVAIKKTEHHPLISKIHPLCLDRVSYWEIHDVDVQEPARALAELEKEMEKFISVLQQENK